jgi:hypothetical protein
MIKDSIRKKILMNAISLEEELGIMDLAWTKADIIKLINSLIHEADLKILKLHNVEYDPRMVIIPLLEHIHPIQILNPNEVPQRKIQQCFY